MAASIADLPFCVNCVTMGAMYTPAYTITNTILKFIGIIEAAREVINHAPLLPYYEKKFQDDAKIRTIHHGTHVEGNALNIHQAEKVLQGQQVIARQRDVQEVMNYRKVIEYLDTMSEKRLPLTEELLKKVHILTVEKILAPELCGVFRSSQVVIKNSLTGAVSFRPPPAISVPFQIRDLLGFIPTAVDIHPVLLSGIVHYELARIHPFVDGNGRVSRALATFLLSQSGYDIRKFFSLEEYFDTNAAAYYTALQSVEKQSGDQTEWLSYFTEGLAIELTKIKEKVERISVDGKLKSKLGGKPLLLSDRQLKLIEYIQQTGYLQNSAFKQLFPFVSEDTVLNELKGLITSGLIKKQGATKAAKYVMN